VGDAQELQPEGRPADRPARGPQRRGGLAGQQRSNDTHASTTVPEARLYRKIHNTAATLCYSGHLLMEHSNALIVDAELITADGYAERATALELIRPAPATARRRTVAGDKGYDTRAFIAEARQLGFTPHVAQNTTRQRSAIDGRTIRHPGRQVSMRIRKRIEEPFGWTRPSAADASCATSAKPATGPGSRSPPLSTT
jgi:Transposase DDE domain